MRSQHGESDGQDSLMVRRPVSDRQIKDNFGRYRLKSFEMAKKGGAARS